MDQSIFSKLYQKGIEYGIPLSVWYPIVMFESGGDPTNIGDGGTSYGLLQIHKPAHPSFDTSKYTDPDYQADFYFPELKSAYDEGVKKGLSGADLTSYVERYGERPKWSDEADARIRKEYMNLFTNPNVSADLKSGMTAVSTALGGVGGILAPPGLGSGGLPSIGNGMEEATGINPFNPSNWGGFISEWLTKAAFFIPALILLTLGLIFLFASTDTGQEIISQGKSAAKMAITKGVVK